MTLVCIINSCFDSNVFYATGSGELLKTSLRDIEDSPSPCFSSMYVHTISVGHDLARRLLSYHVLFKILPTAVVGFLPYEYLYYAVLPQTLCARVRSRIRQTCRYLRAVPAKVLPEW